MLRALIKISEITFKQDACFVWHETFISNRKTQNKLAFLDLYQLFCVTKNDSFLLHIPYLSFNSPAWGCISEARNFMQHIWWRPIINISVKTFKQSACFELFRKTQTILASSYILQIGSYIKKWFVFLLNLLWLLNISFHSILG